MTGEYNEMLRRDPKGFATGLLSNGHLASAIFAGTTSKGALTVIAVYFEICFSPDGVMPQVSLTPHLKAHLLPWSYDPTSELWFAGSEDKDGVLEFEEGKTPRAIRAHQRLQDKIASESNPDKEALKLEFAIQSALDWAVNTNEVGGEVDMLELRSGSTNHWITVKNGCNQ